jgi:hypothetical protein
MLKWIYFPFILFLIPGFPMLQCDYANDFVWLVSGHV